MFYSAAIVFIVYLVHGLLIGPADDEAYYWYLAQNPKLGFAYHPPMVVWSIAFFQAFLEPFFGNDHVALFRVPSAFFTAVIYYFSLRFLWELQMKPENMQKSSWIILAMPGVFGASWMMVPDLPLLAGLLIALWATWKICFQVPNHWDYLFLALGITIAVLSKYSAIAIPVSASACFWYWRARTRKKKDLKVAMKAWSVTWAATGVALFPTLLWNVELSWAPLMYQIEGRHGGGLSLARYGKFWASQLLFLGPPLVLWGFLIFRRNNEGNPFRKLSRFILFWILPPAIVFFLQPLKGDFKPHWTFVIWIPLALELAYYATEAMSQGFGFFQRLYGLPMLALGLISCHVPIVSWVNSQFQENPNPTHDITNDLYGWDQLGLYLNQPQNARIRDLPVIGSRYQTASQAAFSLGRVEDVTRVPRPFQEIRDFAPIEAVDSTGPGWPNLRSPVLYVTDNRYRQGASFVNGRCRSLKELKTYRSGIHARTIELFYCEPR